MSNKAEVTGTSNVSDDSVLERLVAMLEKVLLQSQSDAQPQRKQHREPKFLKVDGLKSTPCSVCNDCTHTAFTHCLEHRLCFLCHSPEHSRRDCVQDQNASRSGQQGNQEICVQGRTAQSSSPPALDMDTEYKSLYDTYSGAVPSDKTLIIQHMQKLSNTDSLFHTDLITENGQVIKALVDSGSMACTINEETDAVLTVLSLQAVVVTL